MSTRGARRSDPAWLRPIRDRLTPLIQALVVIDALLFLLFVFAERARPFMVAHLAITPAFLGGELWQPVTALFFHIDPLNLVFSIIGLWFVGAGLERTIGTRRFAAIYFGVGIAANALIAVLVGLLRWPIPYSGSGPAILALFAAFGAIYDRQEVSLLGALVMPARTATLVLVGFSVVVGLIQRSWPGVAGDVFAAAAGWVLAGGRGGGFRDLFRRRSPGRDKPRRRYQVIDGGRKDRPSPPSYLN